MEANLQGKPHALSIFRLLTLTRYPSQALQLLEYVIKHGSERVVDDARSHLSTIKMLRNFHYIDEKGKDQGINGQLKNVSDCITADQSSQCATELMSWRCFCRTWTKSGKNDAKPRLIGINILVLGMMA